jgi:hypothetical protein
MFTEQFDLNVSDGKLTTTITLDIQLVGGAQIAAPIAAQLNAGAPTGRSLMQTEFSADGSEMEAPIDQLLNQFTSANDDTIVPSPASDTQANDNNAEGGYVDLTITLPQDEFNQ